MISKYPEFTPLDKTMYNELSEFIFNMNQDGISEFTFLSLLIHQNKYNYNISSLDNSTYILFGSDKLGDFFAILGTSVPRDILKELLNNRRWKLISQTLYDKYSSFLTSLSCCVSSDRDNEDYLYSRESLSTLSGKTYQKKRNLANTFDKTYSYKIKPIDINTAKDAVTVLNKWIKEQAENLDVKQCLAALALIEESKQDGVIIYVDSLPIAFALGEVISSNNMFVVHFEKALVGYKGVYQAINRALAQYLNESITYINREQDLGDEGLRQSKLTYRPISFVKKYQAILK